MWWAFISAILEVHLTFLYGENIQTPLFLLFKICTTLLLAIVTILCIYSHYDALVHCSLKYEKKVSLFLLLKNLFGYAL
jgi:hypothetical protein